MRAERAKRVSARSASCLPKGRGLMRAIWNRGRLGARFFSLDDARCVSGRLLIPGMAVGLPPLALVLRGAR